MTKITLTQEQAAEVAKFSAEFGYTPLNFHSAFHKRTMYGQNFNSKIAESIQGATEMGEHNEFGILQKLYAGDYEIEQPPLKVGDWAKHETKDRRRYIGKIHNIDNEDKVWSHWNGEKHAGFIDLKDLEKMTPEEIRAEEERRKWAGIEEGDVLIGKKSGALAILVMNLPEHSEVKVRLHNDKLQTWDKDSVELYAKKVGATND